MKVLCTHDIGEGKECGRIVYDDGVTDDRTMLGYCEDHRRTEEDSETFLLDDIFETVKRIGLADHLIISEILGIPRIDASVGLSKLWLKNKVSRGAGIRGNVYGSAILVYTPVGREDEYHGKSTERYDVINMHL